MEHEQAVSGTEGSHDVAIYFSLWWRPLALNAQPTNAIMNLRRVGLDPVEGDQT